MDTAYKGSLFYLTNNVSFPAVLMVFLQVTATQAQTGSR